MVYEFSSVGLLVIGLGVAGVLAGSEKKPPLVTPEHDWEQANARLTQKLRHPMRYRLSAWLRD